MRNGSTCPSRLGRASRSFTVLSFAYINGERQREAENRGCWKRSNEAKPKPRVAAVTSKLLLFNSLRRLTERACALSSLLTHRCNLSPSIFLSCNLTDTPIRTFSSTHNLSLLLSPNQTLGRIFF